ncbi:MAG: erythromycin esterase family protein [Microbacterium sp.]|uniref:erythromycin esterase family protein n=1 Tax=Microbacterium sp. TaxID=51671 RepID=UPI0039E226F0
MSSRVAASLTELVMPTRVFGWAEGLHNRAEYLTARNAVVAHGVDAGWFHILTAETNFAASRAVDAYLGGAGDDEPSREIVAAAWSWHPGPLRHNAELLRWLRVRNRQREGAGRIRFYGLDMFGDQHHPNPPVSEAADRAVAAALTRRLRRHRAAGGDHRDLAVRGAAQYAVLREVAHRHPGERLLVFAQTEHLDPARPASLGSRLARGALGEYAAVGAVWDPDDPTVRYPLGGYAGLAGLAAAAEAMPLPGGAVLSVPTPADAAFPAVVYASRLHAAPEL